ncbi:HAD family hydrolase [Psychrobacter sp. AOP7-A1-18]|uniref:HAD family hydrolase n=1 Tax=Psychrobacter sp. AOP7-A1-18 TaxID=3457647 RepID=UPI00402B68E7
MNSILNDIDKYKVISFDIFDTLITRVCVSPRDVFTEVEKRFKFDHQSLDKVNNFRAWRIRAESLAEEKAQLNGREECSLDEIYNEIKIILNLSDNEVSKLKAYELEIELESVIPRKIGVQLLKYALAKEKKVIFISDMYLNSEQIKSLLERASIPIPEDIFVSCEIGVKKKTGKLFEHVCNSLGLFPKDILHIGDNVLGDYKSALDVGLNASRIPRAIDLAKADKSFSKFISYYQSNKNSLSDIYLSLVSNKYFDNPSVQYGSLFMGDSYRFGYLAFSLVSVSYAIWLHEQARKNNIDKLIFLSRDMKVIYDVYRKLYPSERVSYMYSSRRSVKVPMISSRAGLMEPIYNKPIYSNRIGSWLNYNYGLLADDEVLYTLRKFGIPDFDVKIGNKFNKDTLAKIVLELQNKIYELAKKERKLLTTYLASYGLTPKAKNIAVVDIGYAASMQSAYMEILNNSNIKGFYFATFNTALNKVPFFNADGYVCNYASPKSSENIISTHRFLVETLFCDSSYSFKNFDIRYENSLEPVFDITDYDDSKRVSCINNIHEGVLDFTDDLVQIFGDLDFNKKITSLDPVSACKILTEFVKYPNNANDINIFTGIRFHDGEAPDALRYILPPNLNVSDNSVLWHEGFKFLLNSKSKKITNSSKSRVSENEVKANHQFATIPITKPDNRIKGFSRKAFNALEEKLILKFSNEKKYKKYLRDRKSFFMDSKAKIPKIYYVSTEKLSR